MKLIPPYLYFSLTLLFIIANNSLFSQASVYKSFCDNPSWTQEEAGFAGTFYYSYTYQKDTTIALKTYKKIINAANPSSFCLFRENVSLKRVYAYDLVNSIDYVYADFSLNLGNTFMYGTSTGTVTQKDSVLINGQYHNHLYISLPGLGSLDLTEGILSQRTPLTIYGSPVLCIAEILTCMCHNGTNYYNNGGFCYVNCITTGIKENKMEPDYFSLFPNPSSGILYLETINEDFEKTNLEVEIIDVLGKKVKSIEIHNRIEEINLSEMEKGIYFVRVSQNNKMIYNKKIVKQ